MLPARPRNSKSKFPQVLCLVVDRCWCLRWWKQRKIALLQYFKLPLFCALLAFDLIAHHADFPVSSKSWRRSTCFCLFFLSCHFLSLHHLKELHHLHDAYLTAKVGAGQWVYIYMWIYTYILGVCSATETKTQIRWSWKKVGCKKSLCGGNIFDLYQEPCPSCQTFFQKAEITDLSDEEHKAPFQKLPLYFFNIEVGVYLETSSKVTLCI